MVAKHQSQTELTYDERVTTARANLRRHLADHRQEMARFRAEHSDPAAALDAFVSETFDRDSLLATWREWRAERGKLELDET